MLEYWSTGVLECWSERAWGFIPPTERIRTGCALGSGWGPAPQSPPGKFLGSMSTFRALKLSLDFLGEPGSQAQLAWGVRLGRCCRSGNATFPSVLLSCARAEHERLEDEIFRQLDEEERWRWLAEVGAALMVSCFDSDSD